MEFLQSVPEGIWANGITPVLVVILLASGLLVTRREHNNMTKLMEYFRSLVETKDETIRNQADALAAYKDAANVTKHAVETVRDIAQAKREEE